MTRLNAEIDAITADAQRDITALSGALHSAVTALRHMTLERDRHVEAYYRQIETNRSLRARLLGQESVAA